MEGRDTRVAAVHARGADSAGGLRLAGLWWGRGARSQIRAQVSGGRAWCHGRAGSWGPGSGLLPLDACLLESSQVVRTEGGVYQQRRGGMFVHRSQGAAGQPQPRRPLK